MSKRTWISQTRLGPSPGFSGSDIRDCTHDMAVSPPPPLCRSSYSLYTDTVLICFEGDCPVTSCGSVRLRACQRCTPASLTCVPASPSTFASSSRCLATAAAAEASSTPPPPPAGPADPKISKIVDDISGLTLLQASELVSLLKVRGSPSLAHRGPLTACPWNIDTTEHSGDCHASSRAGSSPRCRRASRGAYYPSNGMPVDNTKLVLYRRRSRRRRPHSTSSSSPSRPPRSPKSSGR